MIDRLARGVRGGVRFVSGQLAERVATFLLVIGLAGAGTGLFLLSGQLYAQFAFSPATATVVEVQWVCGPEIARSEQPCTLDEAASFRERGVQTEQRVTFVFADGEGRNRTLVRAIGKTGLNPDDVKPGDTFALRYDAADPDSIALPLGADRNALLLAGVGIVALALYAVLFVHRREIKPAERR